MLAGKQLNLLQHRILFHDLFSFEIEWMNENRSGFIFGKQLGLLQQYKALVFL